MLPGNDKVIKHFHVNQCQRTASAPASDGHRHWKAQPRRTDGYEPAQRPPHYVTAHFSHLTARSHAGLRPGDAAKQLFGDDQAVLCIKPQRKEDFVLQISQMEAQKVANSVRRTQRGRLF